MRSICPRFAVWGALVGLLASGCGGEEPPDFGPPTEFGSATVRWTLFNAAGEAITCAQLGAVDTYVAVGGQPRIVTCGEEPMVTFDNLLPQRYPVVIRLRGIAESTLAMGEAFDNIVVEGGKTTELVHEFRFDENTGNTGAVRVAWRVNGKPADMGCAEVGATVVRGETTDASVAQFAFSAACEDGELVQSSLRPGNYEVVVLLEDDDGNNLSARSAQFRVLRQATVDAFVDFTSTNRPTSTMHVEWTISSSVAADACREDWSIRMLVQEDRMTPIQTASATAACDAGAYTFETLPSPPNPTANKYKITVTLVEVLRGDIADELVDDLQLFPSETTTVSVDLVPPD